MDPARVVILSSRTLFAEGVAARLRQQLGEHELRSVDACAPDALSLVIQAQPDAVVLDGTDAAVTQHCPLGTLIAALPWLVIIQLDPGRDQIRVVTSQQRGADDVHDLIEVIRSAKRRPVIEGGEGETLSPSTTHADAPNALNKESSL